MIDLMQLVTSITWFILYGALGCLVAGFAAYSATKVMYRSVGVILLSVIAYHGFLYASNMMKLDTQLPLVFFLFSPVNVTEETTILSMVITVAHIIPWYIIIGLNPLSKAFKSGYEPIRPD